MIRWKSYEIWCCVFLWVLLHVLKDSSAFICRVKQSKKAAWFLKMKALQSLEMLAATRPVAQHHIPEQCCRENVTSHMVSQYFWVVWSFLLHEAASNPVNQHGQWYLPEYWMLWLVTAQHMLLLVWCMWFLVLHVVAWLAHYSQAQSSDWGWRLFKWLHHQEKDKETR